MIAPIRETSSSSDANAKLLARARRAVAVALLQSQQAEKKKVQDVGALYWAFAAWTIFTSAIALSYAFGWLKWVDY